VAIRIVPEGKPWYLGLAIGLVIGGVFYALGSWQLLNGKRQGIAAAESRLAELQAKLQEGRTAQRELPQFREQVRQLELELDKLLRILPARRNTPDLMRRIRSLTEQGDFALKRFTPGLLLDKEFFSEWPIAVNLEGSYHNLALFFDRISRFSRIINIEDLEIKALQQRARATQGAQGTQHTIAATFNAKTFVYKEPVPEEETAAGGEDKTGRRRGRPGAAGAAGGH
jgi:Tfp pilus assembly protein PilO